MDFVSLHKSGVIFMYKSDKVAEIIKELAKIKGIQLKTMLVELQLNKNTLSNMYKGSMLKADSLARISDYLECSIDFLMGRTDDPTWHKPEEVLAEMVQKTPIIMKPQQKHKKPEIMLPYYSQSASAGDGNYIFDELPEWHTVPKNSKTEEADFMLMVSGDSMLPKFADGDIVLVKKTPSIFEGEIGIFYIDGDAFIKQMGSGELISLNPDYPNIAIKTCNDVRCFGQVIGVLDA
nr:MAG TPA: repressor protein [Caudoviricetes sp.]